MPQIPIYQSRTNIDQVSFPRANPQVAALPFEAMGDVARAQIQAGELSQRTTAHYIELSNRLNDLFETNDLSSRMTDAQMELTKAYNDIQQTPEWNSNPGEARAQADSRFKEIVNSKLDGVFNPKKRSQLQDRLNSLYGHFSINLMQEARKKEIQWSRAGLMSNLEKIHMAAVGAKDPELFDNMLAESKQLLTEHLSQGSISPEDAVRLYNSLSKGAAKDFATADVLKDAVGAIGRASSGKGPYAHLDEAQRQTTIKHAETSIRSQIHEVDRLQKEADRQQEADNIQRTVGYLNDLHRGNWNDAMSHVLDPDFFKQINVVDAETQNKIIGSVAKRQNEMNQLEDRTEKERVRDINMDLARSFVDGKLTEDRVQASGLPAQDAMKWSNALEKRGVQEVREASRRAVNDAILGILDDQITDESQLLPILQEHGVEAFNKVTSAYENRFKLKTGGWWKMSDDLWKSKFKDMDDAPAEHAGFAALLSSAVKEKKLAGYDIYKEAEKIIEDKEKSLVDGKWNALWNTITFGFGGTQKSFSDLWNEKTATDRMKDRFIRKNIPRLGGQ